jgi:hypothetical protein
VKCCVVGVPKSIDNDILLIDRCFGFETAVAEAQKALLAAKVEARSAFRCAAAFKSASIETMRHRMGVAGSAAASMAPIPAAY